jgi:hypothetical protein
MDLVDVEGSKAADLVDANEVCVASAGPVRGQYAQCPHLAPGPSRHHRTEQPEPRRDRRFHRSEGRSRRAAPNRSRSIGQPPRFRRSKPPGGHSQRPSLIARQRDSGRGTSGGPMRFGNACTSITKTPRARSRDLGVTGRGSARRERGRGRREQRSPLARRLAIGHRST